MAVTEKTNSELFLEYMMANGFNPNNYSGILELGHSAHNSMSRFLKDYRQYLLSKQVEYSELEKYGIDGANGYILDNEICVPKSLKNDKYFLYNDNPLKVPYQRHGYSYPSLEEFDTVISNGEDWLDAIELMQDKFYGICLPTDSFSTAPRLSCDTELMHLNKQHFLESFITIADYMSDCGKKEYEVVHDTDSQLNKDFFLIKAKKLRYFLNIT